MRHSRRGPERIALGYRLTTLHRPTLPGILESNGLPYSLK